MMSIAAAPMPITSFTTPSIRHTLDFGRPARNTSCSRSRSYRRGNQGNVGVEVVTSSAPSPKKNSAPMPKGNRGKL